MITKSILVATVAATLFTVVAAKDTPQSGAKAVKAPSGIDSSARKQIEELRSIMADLQAGVDSVRNSRKEQEGFMGLPVDVLMGFGFIALVLALLLCTAFILALWWLYPRVKLLDTDDFRSRVFDDKVQRIERRLDSAGGEIERTHSKLKSIENQQKDILDYVSSIRLLEQEATSENRKSAQSQEANNRSPLSQTRTLYFSAPNNDGSFLALRGRESIDPNTSIYRFEVDSTGKTATFALIQESQVVKRVLNVIDTYLTPVCEIVNQSLPNPQAITTLVQGTASLEGERWVVKAEHRLRLRFS